MSARQGIEFIEIINNRLFNIYKDAYIVEEWFLKLLFIKYADARNILTRSVDYTNKESVESYWIELNKKYPDIFKDFNNLSSEYIYDSKVIELLNKNIEKDSNIKALGSFFEEFKTLERAVNFTSTNRNSNTLVTDKNITTVTQIFTPKWVSKYMVNNTLVNLDSKYNLTSNVVQDFKTIKILDPCLGTGYLLIDAFKNLVYKYQKNTTLTLDEIIFNIYQNQLYGFDIDNIAITIAKFTFLILAIDLSDTFKEFSNIRLNFHHIKSFENVVTNNPEVIRLKKYFVEASLYGSLIKTPNIEYDKIKTSSFDEKRIVTVAKLLNYKYDVVITNPPYMGRKVLPKKLLEYLNKEYVLGKSELYTAFIQRCIEFTKDGGMLSMITLHTWMFIKSFTDLRRHILKNYQIESLLHLGKNTFSALNSYNALAMCFVLRKVLPSKKTTFVKLDDFDSIEQKEVEFFKDVNYYNKAQNQFLKLSDASMVYWLNDIEFKHLTNTQKLNEIVTIRQGLATGDNEEFVRYWYEVDFQDIGFDKESIDDFLASGKKYAPYNKGGDQTKWYSTSKTVIKFDKYHFEKLQNQGNHLPSKKYYFKEGITWSLFGFNSFNVRFKELGYVFDVSGSSLFTDSKYLKYILAYLSSDVAFYFLSSIAPTVNFQVGNIGNLPIIIDETKVDEINAIVDELIEISMIFDKDDELSWDFKKPLVLEQYDVNKSFLDNLESYKSYINSLYKDILEKESKLNEIFNYIYKVKRSVNQSSITKNLDSKQIVKDIISYAVGVVFNRYKENISIDNIDKSDFVNINDVIKEIKKVISYYVDITEVESVLKMTIDDYMIKHFGKDHIKKYLHLPLYWYKQVEDKIYIGYYHTLENYNINKDDGIKKNYEKNNLLYKLK